MSNSYRKNPFRGICADSDKQDKIYSNKKFRRVSKVIINKGDYDDVPQHLKEVFDVYEFNKDGKFMFDKERESKLLRK